MHRTTIASTRTLSLDDRLVPQLSENADWMPVRGASRVGSSKLHSFGAFARQHVADLRVRCPFCDLREHTCRHAHSCAPRQRSRTTNSLTSKRGSRAGRQAHYARHAATESETLILQAAVRRRSTERPTPCCSASTRNTLAPPQYAFTTFSFNGSLCFAMKNIPKVESMPNFRGVVQIEASKRRRLNLVVRDRANRCERKYVGGVQERRRAGANIGRNCHLFAHTGRWEIAAIESYSKRLKTIL